MTETGFGMDFLPPSVQRRMAVEDAAEAKQARQEKQEREVRREQLHDSALQAYRAAAEARGEVVSAVALATGQAGGRSLADIFDSVIAAADQEDARQGAQERSGRDDWGYVGRSAWPGSEYELDRTINRAQELHRDLVAYRGRHDYPAAQDAARAKAGGANRVVNPLAVARGWISR